MNWHAVWQYVVGGAIVSWPPVLAGFWVNWRKTRAHVDRRTAEQTEKLERVTDNQTGILLHRLGRAYQDHGDDS